MPKVNLEETIHAGGKVFFKGEAFVSDADKALIDTELERRKEAEQEAAEGDSPKKGKTKTDK